MLGKYFRKPFQDAIVDKYRLDSEVQGGTEANRATSSGSSDAHCRGGAKVTSDRPRSTLLFR